MEDRTEVIVKPCHYGCGVTVHFENHTISRRGKKIPLEGDNTPHDRPFSPFNEEKNSNLRDSEIIENTKKLFLNTLNRRLVDYAVVDFVISEKSRGPIPQ